MEINSNLCADLEEEEFHPLSKITATTSNDSLIDEEVLYPNELNDPSNLEDSYKGCMKLEQKKNIVDLPKKVIDVHYTNSYNSNLSDIDVHSKSKNATVMNSSVLCEIEKTYEDPKEVFRFKKTTSSKNILCSLVSDSQAKQKQKSYNDLGLVDNTIRNTKELKTNAFKATKDIVYSHSKEIKEDSIDTTNITYILDQNSSSINETTSSSVYTESKFIDPNSFKKDVSYSISPNQILSEITQTTAKVSIGNTTISVPLLKPMSKSKYLQETLTGNISKMASVMQPRKIVHQTNIKNSCALNINHITKINTPTIVSLSQIHIKPLTNTKIVQATVVNNKLQLQSSKELSAQSTLNSSLIRGKPSSDEISLCHLREHSNNSSNQNFNSENSMKIQSSVSTEVQKYISKEKPGSEKGETCNISLSQNGLNFVKNPENSTTINNLSETASLSKPKTKILPETAMRLDIKCDFNASPSTTISQKNDIIDNLLQKNNGLKNDCTSIENLSAILTTSTSTIYTSPMPSISEPILTSSIVNSLTSSISTRCNKLVATLANKPKTISLMISKNSPKETISEITPVILTQQSRMNNSRLDEKSCCYELSNPVNLTTEHNCLHLPKLQTLHDVPKTTSSISVNTKQCTDAFHYKWSQRTQQDTLLKKRKDITNQNFEQDLEYQQSVLLKTQTERTNLNTCGLTLKNEYSEHTGKQEANKNALPIDSKDYIAKNFKDDRLDNYEINNFSSGFKSEDSPNILLKQLLKNSSCNNNHTKPFATNAPIKTCNQVISSRKLINVRAPSLGLVSSLEAQLARPVIPPVSASTDLSTSYVKPEPLNNKIESSNMLLERKINQPIKVISKETSFVSNPKLSSNGESCISVGSPQIQKISLTANTQQANNCATSNENVCSILSNTKTRLSICSSFYDSVDKREQHEKLILQPIEPIHGNPNENGSRAQSPRKEHFISKVYINKNQLPESVKSSTKVLDTNYIRPLPCGKIDGNISSRSNTSVHNMKSNEDVQVSNIASSSFTDSKMNKNNTHEPKLTGNEFLSSAVCRNLCNLKREDTLDLKKKKKRKRDFNTKEDINNISEVNITKKRLRKCLKMDEDYDIYMENLVVQMKNMTALHVIEPYLRLGTTCNLHDTSKNHFLLKNRDLSLKFDNDKSNQQFLDALDFYENDPCGFVEHALVNNIHIQNDFYDQEFLRDTSYNKGKKVHNLLKAKKCTNYDFSENIFSKNYRSNDLFGMHNELWAKQDFPGLIFIGNSEKKIGRQSPIIPFIEPISVKYDSFHSLGSSPLHSKNFIQVDYIRSISERDWYSKKPLFGKPNGEKNNLTVILTVSSMEILSIIKELASILKLKTISSYELLKGCRNTNIVIEKERQIVSKDQKPSDIQDILNGFIKFCRNCGLSSPKISGSTIWNAFRNGGKNSINIISSSEYFCQKACLVSFFNKNKGLPKNSSLNTATHKYFTNSYGAKKCGFKYFNLTCSSTRTQSKRFHKQIGNIMCDLDITLSPSFIDQSIRKFKGNTDDISRRCSLCKQKGDDSCSSSSRLLNVDVNRWVHLNCVLWSHEVYESTFGCLVNVERTLKFGDNQKCCVCQEFGATIKCLKSCDGFHHLLCAKKKHCFTNQNDLVQSQTYYLKSIKGNELCESNPKRRIYVDRDENQIIDVVMQPDNFRYLLRIGSVIYLNIGQLLPHQLKEFHTSNYIYPVGYKAIRFYWSMKYPNKRCRYLCTIAEVQSRPEFIVKVLDHKDSSKILRDSSPNGVWKQILESIMSMKCQKNLFKIFPKYISGDELYGLNEPWIVKILENLPGVENLHDYSFKFGRSPFLDIHTHAPSAARTDPLQKQVLGARKPHTQRTASSAIHLNSGLTNSVIVGEVACPYSKQFVHSKSSQYRKMNQEWRNNVYLARSKIQGLGLYAARDLEKHSMVIEYIGEVIRTEVSEIREKQYEAKNRGIYMFRLDEDRIVDATLSGGLARYINHSCDPNCVTEVVEVERELRIIIFAKRRINRGEELSYDYKFDIEDDANKLPCMCGALNCKKRMN